MKRATLTLLLFLFARPAFAGVADFSAFYFSDSFLNTTTSAYSRVFYDLYFATSLNRKDTIMIGWDYIGTSATDNPGTASTLSTYQTGPKLLMYFGRDRLWRVGLAYNLLSQGSYSSGSTSYTWKGTGLAADLGASWLLTGSWNFTARLNYVSHSLVDQFVGSAYTQVSVNRTYIYPSFGISWLVTAFGE